MRSTGRAGGQRMGTGANTAGASRHLGGLAPRQRRRQPMTPKGGAAPPPGRESLRTARDKALARVKESQKNAAASMASPSQQSDRAGGPLAIIADGRRPVSATWPLIPQDGGLATAATEASMSPTGGSLNRADRPAGLALVWHRSGPEWAGWASATEQQATADLPLFAPIELNWLGNTEEGGPPSWAVGRRVTHPPGSRAVLLLQGGARLKVQRLWRDSRSLKWRTHQAETVRRATLRRRIVEQA